MKISLKPGEDIFINGAHLRADRRISFHLINDAQFLLPQHIITQEDETTPMRRLYAIIQAVIMQPEQKEKHLETYQKAIGECFANVNTTELEEGLRAVDRSVRSEKLYAALKLLRALYALEAATLSLSGADQRSNGDDAAP
jgi:flagellar protein FlbT